MDNRINPNNADVLYDESGVTIANIKVFGPNTVNQYAVQRETMAKRLADKEINTTTEILTNLFKKAGYDAIKVNYVDPKITLDEKDNISGNIRYSFFVTDKEGTKKVNFDLVYKEGKAELPDLSSIKSEVKNIKTEEKEKEDQIKTEIEKQYAPVAGVQLDEDGDIKKEASAGPNNGSFHADIINVDKTWIPFLKKGDIIDIDGMPYEVVGEDYNKMSQNSDGSFITLKLKR